MFASMKVAVVGATGLVGTKMLEVLEERHFPVSELLPVASAKSVGQAIQFKGQSVKVIGVEAAIAASPDIALFSAGGSTSFEWAPKFAEKGCFVIDNSSAWRMQEGVPLVVPEVNPQAISVEHKIIANPNCSTIQMVVALQPLHSIWGIKRIVVSTYQSVTGTGKKAVDQLMNERINQAGEMAYTHKIDLNLIPQIDVFLDNASPKEEMKMVNETKKIMGSNAIQLTATAVRVPVLGGHSESINVEFEREFEIEEVYAALKGFPGIVVVDDNAQAQYPMPILAHNQDAVFVGRIRRDDTQAKTLNLWVVSDNLRKGAATNAVQIAELLLQQGFIQL
jgi:aspartate-semialdehyde dehydrogenase